MLSSKKMNASIVFFLAVAMSLSACTKTREGRMKKDSAPTATTADDKATPQSADEIARAAQAAAAQSGDIKSTQDFCTLPSDMKASSSPLKLEAAAKDLSGIYSFDKALLYQATLSGSTDGKDTSRKLLKTLLSESTVDYLSGETKTKSKLTCVKTAEDEVNRLTQTEIEVSQIPMMLGLNLAEDQSSKAKLSAEMILKVSSEKQSAEASLSFITNTEVLPIAEALKNLSFNGISTTEIQRFELSDDKKTLKVIFTVMQDNQEQLQQDYKDVTTVAVIFKKITLESLSEQEEKDNSK